MSALYLTGRRWASTFDNLEGLNAQVRAASARHGVYIFENEAGHALYVGCSHGELASRIREHRGRVLLQACCAQVHALESTCPAVDEVRLIAALLPMLNRETRTCPEDCPRPRVSELLD